MKIIAVSLLLILTACSSNTKKETQPETIPTPPVVVTDIGANAAYAQIQLVAGTAGLSKYKFKDRSKAPLGYVKGMALAYAQELCHPTSLEGWKNSPETDALIYYQLSGDEKLLTYAFLIGLGMRESSGKYCEGRDMSAKNTSSTSAEAGMFQTSYDIGIANKTLIQFDRPCLLEVFKEGVTCNSSTNYGSGSGLEFQKKTKTCPAFATKVAADGIRLKRKHYGPINRKEVEYRPEAVELLTQVKWIVEANPSVCQLL